jgi:hypothetical protein
MRPAKLRELIVGDARDRQQVLPRLRRRVAARVALEQFRAKRGLQRVDMADHGGVVHAQNLRRARHGAQRATW